MSMDRYINSIDITFSRFSSEPVIYVAASEQFDHAVGIAEHLEITFLCSSPDNEVKSLFVINKFTI